jgi:zinc protease
LHRATVLLPRCSLAGATAPGFTPRIGRSGDHRSLKSFSRLLAALLSLTLLSPAAIAAEPAASSASAASVDVTRATLKNGLQVVVLRDPLAPVVSTWLNYKVGGDEAPIEGLAHAQEHMLFRGSDTIDASQFADTTAITGGTFNADTQNEVTQYFFEMPAQYLDIALHLEASRAQGVLDSQRLWDQERGAITQEVTRDNSDAGYRLFTKVLSHVMAGTPYATTPLGTVDSFKQISGADLKTFYDRWYHPNNAIYVIAGDVDPQSTIAKVRALFESIPAAKLPPRPQVKLEPLSAATYTDDSDESVTSAFIGYRVPGYDDPDYFASEILNDVLNSQRGALFELQATGKALDTGAQSETYPKAGVTLVEADVPIAKPGTAAVADLEAVIEGYKKTGLPPELVAVAKGREVAQAEFSRNSVQGLATLWSSSLANENRTPDEDLAGLERVTLDDVNRVLRTYYDNTTATVAIATPKSASGGGGGGGLAGEDNTIIPTEHAGLPAFARDILANLKVPESKLAPAVSTLPNGIRLIVQPEQISHTVVVRGEIGMNPGMQDPPGKDGIDGIIDNLLPFGTTTYDRLAYQTELDKIAADVSTGPGFSLDVLTANFDRGMQLLADDELHPSFPARAFSIVKEQTVGELSGTVTSPDFKAHKALVDALYPPGDPSRRLASPQSAASITLDDVKSVYAATYRPDLTTIVVIGDITPEAARATVEKYFGGWKAVGPKLNLYPPKVPPNSASSTTIPATGRIQSEVSLSETLPLSYNDADYPVLRLANTVLSGGFYASLLFHDLRELHGYVYTVSSSLGAGHNRSTFGVSYGADPDNIGRAEKLVKDDLAKLQREPLDADRLTRAKALVLGELPVSVESYDGIGSQFLTLSSRQQPLDEFSREAGVMLDSTPATVQAAIAKWIRPNDFVRIITGPAGT